MKKYLVKDQDGKISHLHSAVDPSSLPLPEGLEVLGLAEDFELPEGNHPLKYQEAEGEQEAAIVADMDMICQSKLVAIDAKQKQLLDEADIMLNKAQDGEGGPTVAAIRAYRSAIRAVNDYFEAEENRAELEALDLEAYAWPAKPE